jgi:DNA polymerase beta
MSEILNNEYNDKKNKSLIISNLEELQKSYKLDDSKKWNLKALSSAINSIKKYDKSITSGKQLKDDIKGIGDKIAVRIDEILKTGHLSELTEPILPIVSIENLLSITGVGLVRAKKWLSQGIHNIDDLKKARDEKKVTTTHHIDIGIKYYDDFNAKIPRSEIDIMKKILNTEILKLDKKFVFEICGSYRRGVHESGDIDILVSHPDYPKEIGDKKFLQKIVKDLTKSGFIVDNLTEKGETKFMGVCKIPSSSYSRRIDIRVVDYECYFTALIYFTGSKNFNVFLRNRALEKNLSLNEYSLTKLDENGNGHSPLFLTSEKEIFDILEIPYMTPEERHFV